MARKKKCPRCQGKPRGIRSPQGGWITCPHCHEIKKPAQPFRPLTIDRIIAIAKARGFTFKLLPDGTPAIHGPTSEATPALMRVIALHRAAILARIIQDLSPATATGVSP